VRVFSKDGLRLAGRRAWGSLIENNVKLGVNGGNRIEPSYRVRRWQRGSVRKVNGYGASKMAESAVLVFERLVVPVASRLEGERQHKRRPLRQLQPDMLSANASAAQLPHRYYLGVISDSSVK